MNLYLLNIIFMRYVESIRKYVEYNIYSSIYITFSNIKIFQRNDAQLKRINISMKKLFLIEFCFKQKIKFSRTSETFVDFINFILILFSEAKRINGIRKYLILKKIILIVKEVQQLSQLLSMKQFSWSFHSSTQ